MDIYSYLNSKDVADYCRKIDYQFNALECVFIIYHCRRISVEVKHRQYQKIMREMPDMQLSKHQRLRWKDGFLYPESLFAALQELINEQKQMLDMLKSSSRAVYSYRWTGKGCDTQSGNGIYSNFDKAKAALTVALYEDTDCSMDDIASCEITMQLIDENKSITAEMNDDQKIVFLDSSGFSFDFSLPQNFWAYIPMPFQKGDILINPCIRNPKPFVLDHFHFNDRSESYLQTMKSEWDENDLLAWGFENMDELVSDTPCEIWGYQNLEYYRGEISPELLEIQNKIREADK